MPRGWERVAVALLLAGAGVPPAQAATCSNYDSSTCAGMTDGGCQCILVDMRCVMSDNCSGIGPTTLGCMMGDGTLIEDGASVPGQGDQWCNTCVCTDGEMVCTEMACGSPTMTCGEVKEAYRSSACCGYPAKPIRFSDGRPLPAAASGDDAVEHLRAVLEEAAAKGDHAKARQLAEEVQKILTSRIGA